MAEGLSIVTAKDLLTAPITRRGALLLGGVSLLAACSDDSGEPTSKTSASASPTAEPGLATLPAATGKDYPLETRGDRLIDPGLATTLDRGLAEVHFTFNPEFSGGSIQQVVVFDRTPAARRVVSYERSPRPGYLVDDRETADLTHPVIGLGLADDEVVLFGHGQSHDAASTGMRTYALKPVVEENKIVGLEGSFLGLTDLPDKLRLRDK